jgi:hypothetical protein
VCSAGDSGSDSGGDSGGDSGDDNLQITVLFAIKSWPLQKTRDSMHAEVENMIVVKNSKNLKI